MQRHGRLEPRSRPDPRVRLVVALCLACLTMIVVRGFVAGFGPWRVAGDYTYFYRAARALLDGHSPYAVVRDVADLPYPWQGRYLYPLTATVAHLPLAWIGPVPGLIVLSGISAATLAWAVTRDGYGRLSMFLSPAFFWCAIGGQWSALLTAAALLPALGWLTTVKPTVGLAMFGYRPTWRAAWLAAAFIGLSFACRPTWVGEWVEAVRHDHENYRVPVTATMFGPLLLLAWVRWRRPEARLLGLLACVPQAPFFYDQLPLWLVPATAAQSLALSTVQAVGWWISTAYQPAALAVAAQTHVMRASYIRDAAAWLTPWVMLPLYAVCLLLVLTRPNTGPAPAWLERALVRWHVPRWLAGVAGR